MSDVQEIWQVEAAGKIYNTSFDEMTTWIAEGALIREDKVRKGNLRWIEAGKVPSLIKFFNAKEAGQPIMPVVTVSQPEVAEQTTDDILELEPPVNVAESLQKPAHEQGRYAQAGVPDIALADARAFAPLTNAGSQTSMPSDVCSIHSDAPSAFVCETCSNRFCKTCPNSYGSSVKICPMCGAMCKSVAQVEQKRVEMAVRHRSLAEGFGFGDFFEALAHPFKHTVSLILGAVMFALFSLGQSAGALGGLFMVAAALICYVLANMLTFGVLANTIENFAQGKTDANFMPSFDDFSIWDDVVHPFFLSIGVYITSFGPLLALVLVTVFFVMNAVTSEMNGMQTDAARKVNPAITLAANAAKQSEAVRELINKQNERRDQKAAELERMVAAIDSGEEVPAPTLLPPGLQSEEAANYERLARTQDTEAMVAEADKMITDYRKAQLESVVGKTPDTVAKEREALISKILGYGAMFLLLGGVFLLWGLFYFPAACAVAGYTRSFVATLNPAVGLDTIKRLGFDYVKILFMSFLIVIASGIVVGIISMALSAFDMPGVGNLPAKFIGSLFGFYFSVVFSCVLGFAIFKNAHKLDLAH